ncbi:MAG: 4a-hydroxytetrahydrobiopterin dehydratase [Gammaproteobacteria bacterium RIFCSPHIGHO2_12_FULL_37_34]|nr:MAG: 4a-hydroxytetrahydrobiopterin dehydratase [Gammaproteobacteria bacterium RIFCSPHIGHO2_12_FULL_37_34]
MSELHTIRCVACEGGMPPLTHDEINQLLIQVKQWQVSADNKQISRRFTFKNFYKTMAFVNAIAWIANQENHHPDLEVGFNYCLVHYSTHAINGLTKNDFICAAKIDALEAN